jgi:hypothetical protein
MGEGAKGMMHWKFQKRKEKSCGPERRLSGHISVWQIFLLARRLEEDTFICARLLGYSLCS